MGQGRQAKILSEAQIKTALLFISQYSGAERDRVIFLLSVKSGLRSKEISSLTWDMVTDAEGNVGDTLNLTNQASKGKSGRTIYLHKEVKKALIELKNWNTVEHTYVINSQRGDKIKPNSLVHWFKRLYERLGYTGCSSHSGRRTFGTNGAKKIIEAGGSLKDIQELLGHTSLTTTQKYIQGTTDAKKKLMDLI